PSGTTEEPAGPPAATPPPAPPGDPVIPRVADPVPEEELPQGLNFVTRLGWCLQFTFRAGWTIAGIILLTLLANLLLMVVTQLATGGLLLLAPQEVPPDPAALLGRLFGNPALILSIAISSIAGFLVMIWGETALLRLPAAWLEEGRVPPFGQLARQALSRTPDVATALGLVLLIPLILLLAPLGWLQYAGSAASPAFALLLLAVVAASIFFLVALSLTGAVAANEEIGPWDAVRRAWDLARGYRWAIVGNVLFLMLAVMVLYLLLQFAGFLLGLLAGLIFAPLAVVILPLTLILMVLLQFLSMALFHFLITLFYLEARVVKEGWRPPWREALRQDWPRSDAAPPHLGGRGVRAWMELLGVTLLATALLAALMLWTGRSMEAWLRHATTGLDLQMQQGQGTPPAGADQGDGLSITLGVDTFFTQNRQDPSLWLVLRLNGFRPLWPAELHPQGLARIVIEEVRDDRGGNRYNAGSQFEQGVFSRVDLQPGTRQGELRGIRTVHLLPGTREEDVKAISGRVELNLPDEVSSLVLTPAQEGETVTTEDGLKFVLQQFGSEEIRLALPDDGPQERLLGVLGVDNGGRLIAPVSRASSRGRNRWISYGFSTPVRELRLYLGGPRRKLELPFTLRPGAEIQLGAGTAAAQARPAGGDIESLSRRAHQLFTEGRYEESIRLLDQVIAAEPDNGWAWYTRGWARWKLGRTDQAYEDVAKACDLGYKDGCKLRRQ
ncbi:MAG: tetratricopeptide repeat protein, partial [Gammaproteobacteria bacterium]